MPEWLDKCGHMKAQLPLLGLSRQQGMDFGPTAKVGSSADNVGSWWP